jgi:hypothetical protein
MHAPLPNLSETSGNNVAKILVGMGAMATIMFAVMSLASKDPGAAIGTTILGSVTLLGALGLVCWEIKKSIALRAPRNVTALELEAAAPPPVAAARPATS